MLFRRFLIRYARLTPNRSTSRNADRDFPSCVRKRPRPTLRPVDPALPATAAPRHLARFPARPFAIAKASAYSSILTFFPFLLVVGSVLATLSQGDRLSARNLLRAGPHSARRLRHRDRLPAGNASAAGRLAHHHLAPDPVDRLRRHDFLDGRLSQCLPAAEDLGPGQGAPDRLFAGHHGGYSADFCHHCWWPLAARIETRILFHIGHELGPYILLLWGAIRWLIATLTSIAVIALDLPQRRAAHPALAQRAARRHSGHRHVVRGHHCCSAGTCGATRTTASSMARWEWHCAAGLDVHGLSHHPGGRGVQRHALPADSDRAKN